jgi:radical SAM protein with 4Fe4S-binding SPASM domain
MIVVWRVVDSCNLSCPFCAFDKRLAFPRTSTSPGEVLRFMTVLADYQAAHNDPVLVSWLGGEPLLSKPLAGLTIASRAKGLRVSATTNGTTLGNARVREHIVGHYQELTISVDGFSALHDTLRGWPGGFDKLGKWIPVLADEARRAKAPLKLRVNVVLMRDNVDDFPSLCLELAKWGVAEITFNQLGGRDRPEFYPSHRLTSENVALLEKALPPLRARLAEKNVDLIGGDAYLKRIRESALDIRQPIADCGPGQSFLFIDERGRVSPCSFTTEDYSIDLQTLQSAEDIVTLPMRFREAQQNHRSIQCDDCLSTQVCEKFAKPKVRTLSSSLN